MKSSFVLIAVGLLLATSSAFGAIPNLISLQGLLRDGAGDPVANGDYSVAFTVYDAAVAGTVLWAETTMVSTTGGLFTVQLGSIHPVPDTLFNDSSRYLGIKIDTDPEMVPRQRLSSVGYSFVSSQWNPVGLDVYRDTGHVGIGVATPLAGLHVKEFDLGLVASPALLNENIIVEDDDAVLGLYSGTGGTYGSAIVLGEIDAGVFTNKWGMYRTKTTAASRLGFSYGTDTSYGANPTLMSLEGSTSKVGIGINSPSAEAKLHVRHFDGDNFGVLVDAHGLSGTEIGLHSGPSRYASLAKNVTFNGGWVRFNDANGAFLQEIEPDGDAFLRVAGPGAGFISWAEALMLKASGNVGVNEPDPLAGLHVRGMDMSLPASPALLNENIIIEDDDAVLGLYSGTGGTYGSAIVLGEIDAGVFTNKWGMYRTKTAAGSRLGFSYGTDTSYGANPAVMSLDGPNSRMGVGTAVPMNRLDVEGAAVIGSAYSGTSTAPSNGLLVQGQVGIATTSVYSDANTNLTLPGSIGFKNGTTPMMYIYESGSTNSDRLIFAHSPAFQTYGMYYDDGDDAVVYKGNGSPRMTVDLFGTNDVLDVNGNVVVGTGTTGCIKDADGTVIAGTCSSDERFKTEIEPFADVLDKLVQLEPVHFRWRADEFPDRKFGTRQSYGLIAQDAEKVMPDLVTEDEEGYLAVRYSKLPLLLLEAVKEQQAQIEMLKAEIALLRNPSGSSRAAK